MRLLISALAAASILAFSLASYAADKPYPAKPDEAGRVVDEGQTVTAPNKPKPAGRAVDEGKTVTAPNKPKPAGRAAEGRQAKSPDPNQPGGAANEAKK